MRHAYVFMYDACIRETYMTFCDAFLEKHETHYNSETKQVTAKLNMSPFLAITKL